MTDEQRECLDLLAQGLTQGDIARLQGVTRQAISLKVRRALRAQADEDACGQ